MHPSSASGSASLDGPFWRCCTQLAGASARSTCTLFRCPILPESHFRLDTRARVSRRSREPPDHHVATGERNPGGVVGDQESLSWSLQLHVGFSHGFASSSSILLSRDSIMNWSFVYTHMSAATVIWQEFVRRVQSTKMCVYMSAAEVWCGEIIVRCVSGGSTYRFSRDRLCVDTGLVR